MSLTTEYFLLVFAAAVGFIQFAAGRGGLRGIMFSQNPGINRTLAISVALPAMALFFTWNHRNPVGIIEGAQQAGLFTLATLAAVLVTVLLSSVLNHRKLDPQPTPHLCLEAIKDITFFQALRSRYFWKR